MKSQLTPFISEKMPKTGACQLFLHVPTGTTHKRGGLSSQLKPKSALGPGARTLPCAAGPPPLWPLAHKDPRDAPKGQQSMLSECCHRRTSRSEPPLSVYLTPPGRRKSTMTATPRGAATPTPGKAPAVQRRAQDDGTRRCCEHRGDSADPENHREPALRSKDLLRTGRLAQGTRGKARAGKRKACFYGSGDSEAEGALTCVR